jgi:DNA polymerase III subunit beta
MYLIETKKLKSALERLWLAVPKKGGLPVLENFRWRVVNAQLNLTATDLDNSVLISVPFLARPTRDSLDVLVPAKELYQAVKSESAPSLTVRITDSKFEVRADRRVLALSWTEPKNFPRIPEGRLKVRGRLLSSALATALEKALFCVSTEDSRYSVNDVKLEMRNSLFRVVGTDGHRLSVVEGAAKNTAGTAFETLLLRSTAAIIASLQVSGESAWTQFSTCESEDKQEFNLFIMPDGSMVIARRGLGTFPNYEKVLPQAPLEGKIVFSRAELLDGLSKLSATVRKKENSPVRFEFSKKPPVIVAENNGTANQIALEHSRISGKTRDVGFNHQYLTQYVKSLETETVSMALFPKAISEAALFETFRYRHLLMPLRD